MSDGLVHFADARGGLHAIPDALSAGLDTRWSQVTCPLCLGMRPVPVVERPVTAEDRANRLAAELAEIKGSLSQVAVYEGLEGSPTALLVSELVKDHEELEARIDAVLSYLSATPRPGPASFVEIARLLRGGKRVPDDIRELEG